MSDADPRLQRIFDAVLRLATGDYTDPPVADGTDDLLDGIAAGLGSLTEDLRVGGHALARIREHEELTARV